MLWRVHSSRTSAMQPSKSLSMARVTAPWAMGWMSWAVETLFLGRNTTARMLATAQ